MSDNKSPRQFAVYIDSEDNAITLEQYRNTQGADVVIVDEGEYGYLPSFSGNPEQQAIDMNNAHGNTDIDCAAALRCSKNDNWQSFDDIVRRLENNAPEPEPVAAQNDELALTVETAPGRQRVFYAYSSGNRLPVRHKPDAATSWIISKHEYGSYNEQMIVSTKSATQLNAEEGNTEAEVYAALLCSRQQLRQDRKTTCTWESDFQRLTEKFAAGGMSNEPYDQYRADKEADSYLEQFAKTELNQINQQKGSSPGLSL